MKTSKINSNVLFKGFGFHQTCLCFLFISSERMSFLNQTILPKITQLFKTYIFAIKLVHTKLLIPSAKLPSYIHKYPFGGKAETERTSNPKCEFLVSNVSFSRRYQLCEMMEKLSTKSLLVTSLQNFHSKHKKVWTQVLKCIYCSCSQFQSEHSCFPSRKLSLWYDKVFKSRLNSG